VHDGSAPLAGGRLDGVVPGDYVLVLAADGHGLRSTDIDGLAPFETRALELELGPGAWVAGRVAHADGTPAPGTRVSCLLPAPRDDSPASPVLTLDTALRGAEVTRQRREIARRAAAADGSFRFELPRSGTYVLAVLSPARSPVSRLVSVVEDEGVGGLELVIP
jgi:hypothetical protein